MSIYTEYIDGLVKLIENGRPDPLKEVIFARLKGEQRPVQGLVSPPLSRDEADENGVFYFVYEKFAAQNNEPALMEMRRVVLELLMEAFTAKQNLLIIDALGQMAGFFQVKEYPQLAEQFRQQLWGFMCTKLGKPPGYKPLTQMMLLPRDEMEYAWRALDLWLTVTPPLPADREAHYYKYIIKLFENGLQGFSVSELHFHLLLLVFRALLKIKPYYAGKCGFLEMARLVEKLDREYSADIYLLGWMGFCKEFGVLFKYDDTPGKKWGDEFKKGLLDIDENLESESIFWKSLQKMDGLDVEVKTTLTQQHIPTEEIPWNEFSKVIYQ